jgi:nucleotide-binding universal stress UspA family protein
VTEPFLFGTVIVGYDGSARARDALRLAELLARSGGTRLLVTSVVEHEAEVTSVRELESEVSRLLGASRRPREFRSVAAPSAARVLHELAADNSRVGLLVLGSTHRATIAGTSPASVAAKLLNGAPCPVAIAPPGYAHDKSRTEERDEGIVGGPGLPPAEEIRVIAVGFDGSAESQAALNLASALGVRCQATLRVIAAGHLVANAAGARARALPGAPTAAEQPLDLEDILHATVEELPRELRALPIFEPERPVETLLDRTVVGVDLLVMGSRGYGPLKSVLLGSVSAHVIGRATCPVLVVPRASSPP